MRKEIYLIKGVPEENYKQFSERILDLTSTLRSDTIEKLSVTYTSESPPKISVIPFKKDKIAAISVYSNNGYDSNLIKDPKGLVGAFKVTEALPVSYIKKWPDKEVTPGTCLLTLFQKKKKIDYETFIHRWHNGHTPLSLEIHPLWHYSRNVVEKKITENSFEWHGIVEEHTRTSSELLNPAKFFGNPFTMFFNMIRVYFDTQSFLDYKTIETYLVSEMHIKS